MRKVDPQFYPMQWHSCFIISAGNATSDKCKECTRFSKDLMDTNEAALFAQEEIDHLLEKGFNPRPYALDEKITELFKGWEDRPDTKLIARMTHLALVTDEADGAINKDLAWMLFSVVLVGTYCHVVLFRNNWVHCKVHLVTGTMVASESML